MHFKIILDLLMLADAFRTVEHCLSVLCSHISHATCECHAKLKKLNSYSAAMKTVKSPRGGQCSLWEGNTNSRSERKQRGCKGVWQVTMKDEGMIEHVW